MSKESVVFLNDRFLPASKASLNIYDLGIVLGATLTEMTRTFRHDPFRLDDHIARLYRSCRYAGIELPLSPAEMKARSMELAAENAALLNKEDDLGIVHFVTPGENPSYAGAAAGSARLTPTVCIHSFRLPFSAWRSYFIDGAHVVTPATRHVPPQCVDAKMKNRSRLHWWIADQQTHAVDPAAVSLLLDLDGNITECAGANFVIVNDRTILSPTPRNILGGISLQTVRELAAELGLGFTECDLQLYDVVNAGEAWMTSTPFCVAPVTKVNDIQIGAGQPGPVFQEMMAAWSARVGLDIQGQIMRSA